MMDILLTSVQFAPSVGGIETVSAVMAGALTTLGHDVTLVTQTPSDEADSAPYRILRRPHALALAKAARRADVVMMNQISLRLGWPTAMLRRPCVIVHHMWTPANGSLAGRLKHIAMRRALNVAVSEAMARSLACPSRVIPNPYADDVFVEDRNSARTRDLVFLGRLQCGKGLDTLLEALRVLAGRGAAPTLSIIGTGPDEARSRARVDELGLRDQVRFAGTLRGAALVAELNRHRLMAVPSVWDEPFGVVVLEGIACGLVPIVTRSGGLPDAVGDCGPIVPRGDPLALADAIALLLADPSAVATYRHLAAAHLARHTRRAIAQRYVVALEDALRAASPA